VLLVLCFAVMFALRQSARKMNLPRDKPAVAVC
jgi:hypothetical protein